MSISDRLWIGLALVSLGVGGAGACSTPGDCRRFTDCDQGMTCYLGHCTVPGNGTADDAGSTPDAGVTSNADSGSTTVVTPSNDASDTDAPAE